jgi:hypothetical protein
LQHTTSYTLWITASGFKCLQHWYALLLLLLPLLLLLLLLPALT